LRFIALATLHCLVALAPATGWSSQRTPIGHSPDVQIPVAPSLFTISGKRHLAYELHITNLRAHDVVLKRLRVVGESFVGDTGATTGAAARTNAQTTLADYVDADLARLIGRPGVAGDIPDKRVLAGGMRAVVYLWIRVGAATPAPSRLVHRIEFEAVRPTGRVPGTVEGVDVAVQSGAPINLSPPLRGGPWVAVYDPTMVGGHRTSVYTINGRARIPARYAIDWVRLDRDGARARGDVSKVANWHGFGADVLAVADGVVTDARDDMSGAESIGASQGAMPLENASGNYVVLRIGDRVHAIYEHLKDGSVRVKTGDVVKRGQVLAQLGNTGSSSSGPHLHFHVADASGLLEAEGLPYTFDHFEVAGAFDTIEATGRDQPWQAPKPGSGGQRHNELPDANVVVMFD